jgi:hypothetical protein
MPRARSSFVLDNNLLAKQSLGARATHSAATLEPAAPFWLQAMGLILTQTQNSVSLSFRL